MQADQKEEVLHEKVKELTITTYFFYLGFKKG
jgi:hypothetical protein